jgi:flagellar biosynthesis protein FlhB
VAEEDHDDKTEAPSQKRLDDAREKGDVPRSLEINIWFSLAAAASVMALWRPGLPQSYRPLAAYFEFGSLSAFEGAEFRQIAAQVMVLIATILIAPLGLIVAAGLAGQLLQHLPRPSLDHVMPQLSRVSPLSGLKRITGRQALAQAIKSMAKLSVVGSIVAYIVWSERGAFQELPAVTIESVLELVRVLALRIFIAVLSAHAVIAGGDYLGQWFAWYQRQKMTKQEVKEEYKQQEGSPEVKNRLRQLRRSFARRAMMGKVKKASVVVMNPTHYAVALRYEEGLRAPLCIAKGVDVLALKIRAEAEKHNVPVVEDPPLARSLYRLVEIDSEIPLDLYKPVAEIIGYVMRLRARRARRHWVRSSGES